jgi:hypothetical protein
MVRKLSRRFGVFIISAVLLAQFAGCGGEREPADPQTTEQQRQEHIKNTQRELQDIKGK